MLITDTLYDKTVESPVGPLRIIASDKGIRAILFQGGKLQFESECERNDNLPLLKKAEKQLAEYFSGTRRDFDLPLDYKGTVFQIKTWRQLQKIPYGETISYGEQAKMLGDARKARAVGMANGRNPVCIVVPCHRVIGASGGLTGFGGGLKAKKWLLEFERAASKAQSAA